MTAILFLVAAVVIATVGILILVLINKKPSKTSLSSIDEFARRKKALAPRRSATPERGTGGEARRSRGA